VAGTESTSIATKPAWQELLQGGGTRVVLWSCASTILVGLLILDLFLLADLLMQRGTVRLRGSQIAAYEQFTAGDAAMTVVAPPAEGPLPVVQRIQQGLRATAWTYRDHPWGPWVAWVVRHSPLLQRNDTALAVLLLAGVVLSLLNGLLLSHIRSHCERIAIEAATRLREQLHRHALRVGTGSPDPTQDGVVLRLFLDDTERVRNGLFEVIYGLCRHPFLIVLLLAVAICLHWLLALQCLIPLAACWYLIEKEKERFQAARRLAEDRARLDVRLLSEGILKPRLIGGYGMEDYERQRFQTHLQRVRDQLSLLKRNELWSRWVIWLIVIVFVAMVIFLVSSKSLLPEENVHHLESASAILLLITFVLLYRASAALLKLRERSEDVREVLERIDRYLSQPPAVAQAVGGKVLRPLSKVLHFEAVSCTLPGRGRVLESLELKLPAGDASAIVSLNPLEPVAMAYLLPRFLEPDSGRILFDEQDIAWATLESLRASTLLVEGDNALFTGTVLENITCGNPAYTLDEVTEAAQTTRADEVIRALPQGYDTVLGEHGERLGPGEQFLIALTRAFLRDPALLIIQEPQCRLDDEIKPLVDAAYERILPKRTVLFLPTRLSTVRRAQRVVLLHRGRVDDVQPYAHLIKSSALFRHWEYVCFNEFQQVPPCS